MENVVKILMLPIPNWQEYIDLVQESLGNSPTRVLDSNGVQLDDPNALLLTLQALTGVKDADYYNHVWGHIHVSFIVRCLFETVVFVMEKTPIHTCTVEIDRTWNLAIFTGNLMEWQQAIYIGCAASVPNDVRLTLNKCFLHFINLRLNLWPKATRRKHSDGTLIIDI
jgi:hypothetical protein